MQITLSAKACPASAFRLFVQHFRQKRIHGRDMVQTALLQQNVQLFGVTRKTCCTRLTHSESERESACAPKQTKKNQCKFPTCKTVFWNFHIIDDLIHVHKELVLCQISDFPLIESPCKSLRRRQPCGTAVMILSSFSQSHYLDSTPTHDYIISDLLLRMIAPSQTLNSDFDRSQYALNQQMRACIHTRVCMHARSPCSDSSAH